MLAIILNVVQTLFIPLGIYILLNLELVAEKSYELSQKHATTGLVTSVNWNKKVLIPISITMIIYGILNVLLVIQEVKQVMLF